MNMSRTLLTRWRDRYGPQCDVAKAQSSHLSGKSWIRIVTHPEEITMTTLASSVLDVVRRNAAESCSSSGERTEEGGGQGWSHGSVRYGTAPRLDSQTFCLLSVTVSGSN